MPERFTILATSALHPDAAALVNQVGALRLPDDASPAALYRAVEKADALIVRAKLPADVFDHARRLRACVRHGVGLDFIPVEAATRAGVPVANLPSANSQAVVEHVVGVALVLARDLHRLSNSFSSVGWRSRAGHDGGFELSGKTLGVVGVGNIGKGVAAAMRGAFGMRVIGYDKAPIPQECGITPVELDRLFAEADLITLHTPSTEETRGMVDARRLALMKPEAMLINAARGDLVDEGALVEALNGGALRSAAIDVFEPEPPRDDHPFLKIPNLFPTPHVAGLTRESSRRMSVESVEETLRILRGERPLSLVNPEVWEGYLERWS